MHVLGAEYGRSGGSLRERYANTGICLQEACGRGLGARAQPHAWATLRVDPGAAHRGSRKRTMDVSLPALRVDSTRLQARGAFCGGRRRLDGSFVCGMCRGLPKLPCTFNSSEHLLAIVNRIPTWSFR